MSARARELRSGRRAAEQMDFDPVKKQEQEAKAEAARATEKMETLRQEVRVARCRGALRPRPLYPPPEDARLLRTPRLRERARMLGRRPLAGSRPSAAAIDDSQIAPHKRGSPDGGQPTPPRCDLLPPDPRGAISGAPLFDAVGGRGQYSAPAPSPPGNRSAVAGDRRSGSLKTRSNDEEGRFVWRAGRDRLALNGGLFEGPRAERPGV